MAGVQPRPAVAARPRTSPVDRPSPAGAKATAQSAASASGGAVDVKEEFSDAFAELELGAHRVLA